MSAPLTLLKNAAEVYCPVKSGHRHVLLAGALLLSRSYRFVGRYFTYHIALLGTCIAGLLTDEEAAEFESLTSCLHVEDVEGCVIVPGECYSTQMAS